MGFTGPVKETFLMFQHVRREEKTTAVGRFLAFWAFSATTDTTPIPSRLNFFVASHFVVRIVCLSYSFCIGWVATFTGEYGKVPSSHTVPTLKIATTITNRICTTMNAQLLKPLSYYYLCFICNEP